MERPPYSEAKGACSGSTFRKAHRVKFLIVVGSLLVTAAIGPPGLAAPGAAPTTPARTVESRSRIQQSESRSSSEAELDERQARNWGLQTEEWARYRQLMRGPLGIYSPNLDPLTALGIEAQSNDERRHYAELQVRMEARRVEKALAYQRAYDEAWKRVYPALQPIKGASTTPSARAQVEVTGTPDARVAVFVKENCSACEERVKQLQAAGRAFDLYMVGSRHEDARIRAWATHAGIEPARVRARKITLNHDAGRWLSIGGQGELPAVVQPVNGRWQRE